MLDTSTIAPRSRDYPATHAPSKPAENDRDPNPKHCQCCGHLTTATHPTVSGGVVCDGCSYNLYWSCADCRRLAPRLRRVDNGDDVCDDCAEQYSECRDCHDLLSDDGESYCTGCTYDHSRHRIHDSGYKPLPDFHGDGPVFLGLELEVRTPEDSLPECVDLALDHLGDLGYLKEDGSIGLGGFEIVTHPMDYSWAMARFPWTLLPQLRSRGASTDTEVGIHVHVSRAGFTSPAHIYRWMKFVYRNETHATRLARRTSDWASFDPDARADIVHYAKGDRFGPGRYQAINVFPEQTFEVRIFASSLEPQQVQAALAFVAASVEYTRTLTAGDVTRRHGWEWTAFVTWIRHHRIYAPLLAEMEALACAS